MFNNYNVQDVYVSIVRELKRYYFLCIYLVANSLVIHIWMEAIRCYCHRFCSLNAAVITSMMQARSPRLLRSTDINVYRRRKSPLNGIIEVRFRNCFNPINWYRFQLLFFTNGFLSRVPPDKEMFNPLTQRLDSDLTFMDEVRCMKFGLFLVH